MSSPQIKIPLRAGSVVSTPLGLLESSRDATSESRQKLEQTGLKDGKCRCGVHVLSFPRLCVCVCDHMCLHVYLICVCVSLYMCVYVCICMYMYNCCVYVCLCVCVYVFVTLSVCICMCVLVSLYMLYMCMHG